MIPYKHKMGQTIRTDAPGVACDRAFPAHYHVPAADAVAANAAGILALTGLGAAAQSIVDGITNPKVPRNVQIDGNVAGITGKVKVYGTNFAGEAISEELTANGITAVPGTLAFKTVTKVDLPAQNHAPAAQTETIEVTAAPTANGDIAVGVTAAVLGDASPKSVTVAVTTALDDVTKTAAAIVAALNEDEDVGAAFTASNALGVITLTAKAPAANDATLAIAVTAGETGVTVGSSTNGTAGVATDQISVGWGDIFGLPYLLPYDTTIKTLFNKAADSMTIVADPDELEKNTFDMTGTPDGLKDIDIYLIV